MEARQKLALVKFGIDPDEVVHKEGRYWMTAEQLGKALGYRDPRYGVLKIYDRHKRELEPFKGVVKLVTPGGKQDVTVFDTDGQYRIALLANTPKAEKFRTFIVNMLKALEREEFVHISALALARDEGLTKGIAIGNITREQLRKQIGQAEQIGESKGVRKGFAISRVAEDHQISLPVIMKIIKFRKAMLTQAEVGRIFGFSRWQIQGMEKDLKDVGIELPAVRKNKVDKEIMDDLDTVLFGTSTALVLKGGAA